MAKLTAFFLSLLMFFFPALNIPEANVDSSAFNTEYTNVFVHGFSGWGEYDLFNRFFPYWGVNNGDLMKYLSARGFECHAASVSPSASAWDRACELYAQLTGTRTDYGEAHSKRCKHDRYGKDYSDNPLIDEWNAENKINLFGHSFGGATVRLLAHLMANGDSDEKSTGNNVSPLFEGGKADLIYSVVTLSAPHNGTSSYNIQQELDSDPNASVQEKMLAQTILGIGNATAGTRTEDDTAIYEMSIDNALALNEKISTVDGIYYFSFACDGTVRGDDGICRPDDGIISGMYLVAANRICSYTGTTANGYVIDERWQANDGLVNTYSALAPLGAPSADFDKDNIQTGVWNIMPIQKGNHTTLQGGMTDYFNCRIFYVDFLSFLNSL